MSPEREQGHITLEEIISNAKEIMMRDGKHMPVLIVEDNNNLVAGQITDLPSTHGERVELMLFLGQAAAKSGRINGLQQVFMVSEGWLSVASKDKPTEMRPADDPEKKEVLIISAIQMKERKKLLKIFEIERDSTEQVISLDEFKPEESKEQTADVPLLDAFIQGFQTAFRTKYN